MGKSRKTIDILDWIRAIAVAVVIAVGLRMFVFEIVRVEGPSMQDTFYTGERVYIDKLFYKIGGLKRGDVVECYYSRYDNKESSYIKRVIGLPGETLEISNGKIYIDGEEYDDPHFEEVERFSFRNEGKWEIPDDCVFVMGDNRLNSNDSRSPYVGPVPIKDVIGRGFIRIWPFNKITLV